MMRQLFLVVACLVGSIQVAAASTRQWLADDFFVETYAPQEFFALPAPANRPTDCRSQIARAVCVVNSRFARNGATTMSRACMQGSEPYVAFFESVYDQFPATLQTMFCSVRTIYVEQQLESVAYGGMAGGGAVIGVRKSVIDEALEISRLISWKEQLPFGGRRDAYDVRDDLPIVDIRSETPPVQLLAYYVIAHEFGHLFDFANDINSFTNCSIGVDSDRCRPRANSFTALSWETGATPKPEFDYPHRREVCYYNCRVAPLPRTAIPEMYEGLAKTGFVSVYASTNIYDDFAESLAFVMLHAHPDVTYYLDTNQGQRYDMLAKLGAPAFAEKRAYMEDFLQRTDLAYP